MATLPKPRGKPYRHFLTAVLHRRFVHAFLLAMLVCYVDSVLIGEKTSFLWSWLPFGAAGLRTLMIAISSLLIFILRVAQIHIGERTTASPFDTFKSYLIRFDTVQTLTWYLLSAWWFSEVYIWSAANTANLHWVIPAKFNERAKLNERPVYLRSCFFILAIYQSLAHLYSDYDRVRLSVRRPKPEAPDQTTHVVMPPLVQIKDALPRIVRRSAIRAGALAVVEPFIYMLILRPRAWSLAIYFAKFVWNLPRSAAQPVGVPPLHIYLLLHSALGIFLFSFLCSSSNVLFDAFLSQEPVKKSQPLTFESKDPNGSLLNGLKARKEVPQTFAFWELALISQKFPDRRKVIFADIDREGGATWTQIMNASLAVIKDINTRIIAFQNLSNPPPPPPPQPQAQQPNGTTEIQTLPRLTAMPKDENIFLSTPPPPARNTRETISRTIGPIAKSYGQSPPWTPQAKAKALALLEWSSDHIHPAGKQLQLSPQTLTGPLHSYLIALLRSPLGTPFRRPFSRRVKSIVLGSPHSHLATIVDASESLTKFPVASLTEDPYGKVQVDVPIVVNLFTETITNIETFVKGLPVDWTDISFKKEDGRKIEDIELVLSSLRDGLGELLEAYRLYLTEVGLTGRGLREARKAAGLERAEMEMQEVGP